MKKITVGLLCLFLVIVTALTTFFVTTTILVQGEQRLVTQARAIQSKYQDLEDLKRYIRDNYYKEVSEETLMEGAKKGLFQILGDPYSVFMNEDEFKSFVESSSGRFPGIGVHITPNPERGIEVISPIEDTPAFAAGIKPLDIIRAVDGVPYSHAEMDLAIKQIKGEPGTDVTLTIYRKETDQTFDIVITRAWIDVKVVKSRMIDGIGYLKLTSFDNGSAAEFKSHFEGLLEQGAKGVVIDLRSNPGGSLNQCVEIADYLLPEGLIVYTEGRTPETNNKYFSDAKQVDAEIVVLVNEGSASASEIVTGAVKDHKRGLVIGTKTFGKGIVQTYRPFGSDSGLKLTTSEYFTPNGTNIHGVGIEPDIVVEPSEEFKALREQNDEADNQLQRALEELRKRIR